MPKLHTDTSEHYNWNIPLTYMVINLKVRCVPKYADYFCKHLSKNAPFSFVQLIRLWQCGVTHPTSLAVRFPIYQILQSTMIGFISKWNQLSTTAFQPRNCRPNWPREVSRRGRLSTVITNFFRLDHYRSLNLTWTLLKSSLPKDERNLFSWSSS